MACSGSTWAGQAHRRIRLPSTHAATVGCTGTATATAAPAPANPLAAAPARQPARSTAASSTRADATIAGGVSSPYEVGIARAQAILVAARNASDGELAL